MPMIAAAVGGLAAGLVHVLSGPDHLAAVAPLAVDSGSRRWRAGLLWGVGHTGGVFVVGLVALVLRGAFPLEAISSWSERLVGAALIAVGMWGLVRAARSRVHVHEHTHGGTTHSHLHVHAGKAAAPAHAVGPHRHTHASFAFGILHGLAGSSHVLGILPALALPYMASYAYLAGFGLGNVIGMTAFSAAVGGLATRTHRGGRNYRRVLAGCSLAAVVVGVAWLLT